MLTALILICSLANTPDIHDCDRNNAIDVVWMPATFGSPITCLMQGQAYLAGTDIGRNLNAGEQVKVMCVRKQAAVPGETNVAARPVPKPLP